MPCTTMKDTWPDSLALRKHDLSRITMHLFTSCTISCMIQLKRVYAAGASLEARSDYAIYVQAALSVLCLVERVSND